MTPDPAALTGANIAAIIAAVGGLLGGLFAGIRSLRGDKFKRQVDQGASLLSGYSDMHASLRTELAEVKTQHAADRAEWQRERAALRAEWAADNSRMREEHRVELAAAYDRIDELGAQIYALQHRPPEEDRS